MCIKHCVVGAMSNFYSKIIKYFDILRHQSISSLNYELHSKHTFHYLLAKPQEPAIWVAVCWMLIKYTCGDV